MSAGKLPAGWEQIEIGDIADVISGGTPKSGVAENFAPSGEGVAWLTPADLSGYKEKYIAHGARDLTTLGYFSCSAKLMPKGTILFSSRAPIGYVAIAANEIATNQGFKSFAFPSDVLPDYAYYFLRNIRHIAEEMGTGTTFKEISGSSAKTLPFVLVPFAEQKIIAEKLDTLLAQVDSTKARLEQIPQILKRFRQAVLGAAMGGKFTTNAGITQSPLTIGYETSKTPPGWKWYKLIKLAQLESGHTPRKTVPEYWENGDVPWVSLQDIRAAHGKKIYKTKFMPTQKGIDNSSARLLPEGTVCFSRDISVGYVTIMGKRMATTQHFANWICGNELKNKYLMFAFMAAKQHLTKSGQGTTVKTIYMPALKELMILIPSLSEQAEIVRRVEQLFAYADTIEKQVNNALARVNNLTQSILAKAFRGELTAQWRAENPELISGENSAAALLEKIKAERAASGGKKASRKKS